MDLTLRQRDVLAYIRQVELQRGAGPTTREVQQHFGFRSQTTAIDHIRALERKHALKRTPGKARALTTSPPKFEPVHVPIYGTVVAGSPESTEAEADGFVLVDRVALGVPKSARVFAVRVRGDSMINAHILDGDIVVCHVCEPIPGQIVAALIDGGLTLKRYMHWHGKPYLKAENPLFADMIPAQELIIQGVLVHLQRRTS